MMEELSPSEGYLKIGHNVLFGYYDQGQLLLNNEATVMDEVHDSYKLYKDSEIRSILGCFLFKNDQVFLKVGSLSGGEKARLALLKLMMSGANVLVLDDRPIIWISTQKRSLRTLSWSIREPSSSSLTTDIS